MIRRERDQLLTSRIEERVTRHQEPSGPPFDQHPKRSIDIALAGRIQDQNLPADGIATRSVEACHQAKFDGVNTRKDDRYRPTGVHVLTIDLEGKRLELAL